MEKRYKLPKEFAEKWFEALASGKYKQGKHWLFAGDKYCCLGVACEVAGVKDIKKLGFIVNYVEVPSELWGEVGLPLELSSLNDNCGYNFLKIIDWVKENVELI